ncbi:MAG: SGNH/GDSL hydrolase family protein [Armatimonadetes bacterium]|nr:SGNH/GDSL hydrolase family protein [Armatimonadota bacterium]
MKLRCMGVWVATIHGALTCFTLSIVRGSFAAPSPPTSPRLLQKSNLEIPLIPPERFTRLGRRLNGKTRVTVACMGDSLAYGIGVAHHCESYAERLRDALGKLYPNASIGFHNLGALGSPADYAEEVILRQRLIPLQPDLVTLQFGGADVGLRVPPLEYQAGMADLVSQIREDTNAAILLAIPPFGDTEADRRMALAAREFAKRSELPCADFDRVLRQNPHDDRGFFQDTAWMLLFTLHPNGYSHNLMARELIETLQGAIGRRPKVQTRIDRGAWVLEASGKPTVRGNIVNQDVVSVETRVTWEDPQWRRLLSLHDVLLRGHQSRSTSTSFSPLPRSSQGIVRLGATSPGRGGYDSDQAEVTISPVIPSSQEDHLWSAHLGRGHIAVGRSHRTSEEDLAAQVSLRGKGDGIAIDCSVTDDRVLTASYSDQDVSCDCVEMLWDLRPEEAQGTPWWGRGVYVLRVTPPQYESFAPASPRKREGRWELWGFPSVASGNPAKLQRIDGAMKNAIEVSYPNRAETNIGGYRFVVTLDNAFLRNGGSTTPRHVGLNVAVVDNDGAEPRRQTVLMLSGGLDTYGSTQRFPLLWLSDDALPKRPVVMRVW